MKKPAKGLSEKTALIISGAGWIVGIALGLLVWGFVRSELIQSGNESGVRNPLFEFIWPAVLAFVVFGAVVWVFEQIIDSISRYLSSK